MAIRAKRIENPFDRTKNIQSNSHIDRFIRNIRLNYVTYITFFSKYYLLTLYVSESASTVASI